MSLKTSLDCPTLVIIRYAMRTELKKSIRTLGNREDGETMRRVRVRG